MQSEVGTALYRRFGMDPADPDSLIVVSGDDCARDSDAILTIYSALGWPWRAMAVFRLVPKFVRDPALSLARAQPLPAVRTARDVLDADGRAEEVRPLSRILVLGGYGGFGARLTRRLAARGHTVLVAGRSLAKAQAFCAELERAEPVVADRNGDIGPLLAQLDTRSA